jgi:hypothetical protein
MKYKLLSFDKENATRTHVHDDAQGDYYSTDIWLPGEEKDGIDEKKRKKRESKRPMKRKYSVWTHIGTFFDDLYEGQGTASGIDGSSYHGEWKEGLRHGEGTMKFNSGNNYVQKDI